MPGALSMALRPRRRFGQGGAADPAPAAGLNAAAAADPGGWDEGYPAALGQQADAGPAPQQRPALSGLTQQQMQKQQQIQRMQDAQAILMAGGAMPPTQRSQVQTFDGPGWSNLPMLAAAGAMLGPTRTGGIAESLGRGFEAGAGAAEQQRSLIENAALRQQQQEFQNSWRQQQVENTRNRNDAYFERVQAQNQKSIADAATDQARAAYLTARAAMTGVSKPNEAEAIQGVVSSLVGSKDPDTGQLSLGPDGKPWSRLTAFQAARSTQSQLTNANTGVRRADLEEQFHQQTVDHWNALIAQATTKEQADELRHQRDAQIHLFTGSKDAAGQPTMTFDEAGAKIKPPAAATAAAPTATAAPAAPSYPSPPAKAVEMLKAAPNSAAHFDQIFGPGAAAKALAQ